MAFIGTLFDILAATSCIHLQLMSRQSQSDSIRIILIENHSQNDSESFSEWFFARSYVAWTPHSSKNHSFS